jgi:hypothetical protein
MHKAERTGLRTKCRHGHRGLFRLLSGSIAVLFVSVTIRKLRLAFPGVARTDRIPSQASVKPSPKRELVLPPAAHEPADIARGFISGAFGLLLASLAIVMLGVLWLFPLPGTDRTLNTPLPVYPEPQLQPSPRQEMQRFLAAERQQLTTYGWIDKAHGIVRIPIDVAMDKIARDGIPGWPSSTAAAEASPTMTAGAKQ